MKSLTKIYIYRLIFYLIFFFKKNSQTLRVCFKVECAVLNSIFLLLLLFSFLWAGFSTQINIRAACAEKETPSKHRRTLTFHSPYRSHHPPLNRSTHQHTTMSKYALTENIYIQRITNTSQGVGDSINSRQNKKRL